MNTEMNDIIADLYMIANDDTIECDDRLEIITRMLENEIDNWEDLSEMINKSEKETENEC
jgi:hypothetical protein